MERTHIEIAWSNYSNIIIDAYGLSVKHSRRWRFAVSRDDEEQYQTDNPENEKRNERISFPAQSSGHVEPLSSR